MSDWLKDPRLLAIVIAGLTALSSGSILEGRSAADSSRHWEKNTRLADMAYTDMRLDRDYWKASTITCMQGGTP